MYSHGITSWDCLHKLLNSTQIHPFPLLFLSGAVLYFNGCQKLSSSFQPELILGHLKSSCPFGSPVLQDKSFPGVQPWVSPGQSQPSQFLLGSSHQSPRGEAQLGFGLNRINLNWARGGHQSCWASSALQNFMEFWSGLSWEGV